METHNQDGDCFVVHGRYMLDGRNDVDGYKLVHGMVTGRGTASGVRFAHCWLEIGDLVKDVSNGLDVSIGKDVYYKMGGVNIDEVFKYNIDEVRVKVLEHKHWGCWDFNGEVEYL